MNHDDLLSATDSNNLEEFYGLLSENLQDCFLTAPVSHSCKLHCVYMLDDEVLKVSFITPSEEQWFSLNAAHVKVVSRLFNLTGDFLEDSEVV